MRQTLKVISLMLLGLLLASCGPDAPELASYLEGSWEGSSEESQWCVTFVKDGKAVTFQNDSDIDHGGTLFLSHRDLRKSQSAEDYKHSSGTWVALRGGRFEQTLKRYDSYIVYDMEENSFRYTNAHVDKRGEREFENKRVANCVMHESLTDPNT